MGLQAISDPNNDSVNWVLFPKHCIEAIINMLELDRNTLFPILLELHSFKRESSSLTFDIYQDDEMK